MGVVLLALLPVRLPPLLGLLPLVEVVIISDHRSWKVDLQVGWFCWVFPSLSRDPPGRNSQIVRLRGARTPYR